MANGELRGQVAAMAGLSPLAGITLDSLSPSIMHTGCISLSPSSLLPWLLSVIEIGGAACRLRCVRQNAFEVFFSLGTLIWRWRSGLPDVFSRLLLLSVGLGM
ncbi:hypothetical protein BRADI_1g37485v3 [Brachypodium distachyon]|uniref:Uncharacterized protein n=1 Tax=Brachypodium distachyon TaxID=15368 RepID=A0A2K2DN71_BRADI|nr:hypothetical protein BRADI_1g37485v3 [Brachypodium distachyon]